MLLQFAVENYRSFHNEEVLNLIPVKARIHPGHILRSEEKGRKVRALPLAVLYGANASGKSNLIRAISTARNIVVYGTKSGASIPVTPFRLGSRAEEQASRFEFVLKHEDVVYTYGFAATSQEIEEEWLFAVFVKQEVMLFERVTEAGKTQVTAGNKLAPARAEKQRIQFVAAGTRPNQLFLTEATERNVELLQPVMQWFRSHLGVISASARYESLALRAHTDEQFAAFVSRFLNVADTGIESIEIGELDMDGQHPLAGMSDEMRRELLDDVSRTPNRSMGFAYGRSVYALKQKEGEPPQLFTLRTKHRAADGERVLFETKAESDGTLRMMHLAPALLRLESAEALFAIDELDRSLHPHLCRMYLDAFLRGVTERGCRGQMILTTHETSLLDLDLLRRDEIWFVEKDDQGASHLTSLAEFKYRVRADLKIDKGYLNGRFGAIPFVGDVRTLFPAGSCR